jgi:hypothetical protein
MPDTNGDPLPGTRRLVRARESLSRQLRALGDRVARVRHAMDVPARIGDHPWRAAALALAAGIVVGGRRKPRVAPAPDGQRHPVRDAALAMVSAAAAKLLRDAVVQWLVHPREAPRVVVPDTVR